MKKVVIGLVGALILMLMASTTMAPLLRRRHEKAVWSTASSVPQVPRMTSIWASGSGWRWQAAKYVALAPPASDKKPVTCSNVVPHDEQST